MGSLLSRLWPRSVHGSWTGARVRRGLLAWVALAGSACSTDDAPAAGSGGSETGDGDGDPVGDGDGDAECSCDEDGPFDACRAGGAVIGLAGGLTADPSIAALDEVCTVTAVSRVGAVGLACPSASVELELAILDAPGWVPGFTAGELVHLRADHDSAGDWPKLGWQLAHDDDGAGIVGYLRADTLDWIVSPLQPAAVAGLCAPTCAADEGEVEAVAVEVSDGVDALLLFAGESGLLGDDQVLVGDARQLRCSGGDPAAYALAWFDEPTATNACAQVLDRVYASVEPGECGLGPDGVVLCDWIVGFDGEQYAWSYSDVGESGGYACVGLDLVRRSDGADDGEPLGTVSADGLTLTWAGVVYSRVDP